MSMLSPNEPVSMEEFEEKAYTDEHGIYRWRTNDTVPMRDYLDRVVGLSATIKARCALAQKRDNEEFLATYNPPPVSGEQAFEMRAAFGEGVEMVNVLTGETHTT